MTYRWFVDLSKWNLLSKAQISELKREGCEGFAIQAGQGENVEDPLIGRHVALAKALKVPHIIKHWIDPTKDPLKQAKYSIALSKRFDAQGIVPDIKQWWMNWDEWYTVNVAHYPGSVRAYSADTLLRFYSAYLRELNNINHHGDKLPIMVCSTQRFLHAYCRQLAVVIRDTCDDFWNASYVAWEQKDNELDISWDDIHTQLYKLTLNPARMPNGISHWGAWRFAILPKRGFGKLDISVITDNAAVKYFAPYVAKSSTKEEDDAE